MRAGDREAVPGTGPRTVSDLLHLTAPVGAPGISAPTRRWIECTLGAVPLAAMRWLHIERHWQPATDAEDVIAALEPRVDPSPLAVLACLPAREVLHAWHRAARQSPTIGRAWLEWDAPAAGPAPAPGVFVDVHRRDDADAALACLQPSVGSALHAHARACWHQLARAGSGVRLTSVGCLWRPGGASPPVRLCVQGLEGAALADLLREVPAGAALAAAMAALDLTGADAPHVAALHLDLDATQVGRVGLELAFDKGAQVQGVWRELAWCRAHAATLGGDAAVLTRAAALPMARALDPQLLALRRVNHLKVSVVPDGTRSVKAYEVHGAMPRPTRSIQ